MNKSPKITWFASKLLDKIAKADGIPADATQSVSALPDLIEAGLVHKIGRAVVIDYYELTDAGRWLAGKGGK